MHDLTKIDCWFLYKLLRLAEFEKSFSGDADYLQAKELGYTDQTLQKLFGVDTPRAGLPASYKMVDTCGAEFDAETPYFYSCHDRECESRAWQRSGQAGRRGAGQRPDPHRPGHRVRLFARCTAVWTLKEMGYEVVIVNNNPETVSTDYDTADRLYFEPLTPEDVMSILRVEKPIGVVVAFGGQTAIKLTGYLDSDGRAHTGHLRRRHRPGRGSGALRRAARENRRAPAGRPRRTDPERGAFRGRGAGLSGAAAPLLRHRRPEHEDRLHDAHEVEVYMRAHPRAAASTTRCWWTSTCRASSWRWT